MDRGYRIALLAGAATAIGWASNWTEFVVLGAALLATVAFSWCFVVWIPLGSILMSSKEATVPRGSKYLAEIKISSVRKSGVFLVSPSVESPLWLRRIGRKRPIKPVMFTVDTSRRMRTNIGPFILIVRSPFGMFRRVISECPGQPLVVLPLVSPLQLQLLTQNSGGQAALSMIGNPVEVSEVLTDYVAGNQPNLIHWRSSAKLGKLMVRRELPNYDERLCIILDVSVTSYLSSGLDPSQDASKRFDQAVDICASLLCAVTQQNGAVFFATSLLHDELVEVNNSNELEILKFLAGVSTVEPPLSGARVLRDIRRNQKVSDLYIVTFACSSRQMDAFLASAGPTLLHKVDQDHPLWAPTQ